MPLPRELNPEELVEDVCVLALEWGVERILMNRLHMMAKLLPFKLLLVSGFRTRSEQDALSKAGDAAPFDRSTHTTCPATGMDLQVVGWSKKNAPPEIRRVFGTAAQAVGLRWGGGSRADERTGLPVDWNHVDLGPRP